MANRWLSGTQITVTQFSGDPMPTFDLWGLLALHWMHIHVFRQNQSTSMHSVVPFCVYNHIVTFRQHLPTSLSISKQIHVFQIYCQVLASHKQECCQSDETESLCDSVTDSQMIRKELRKKLAITSLSI